VASRQPNASRSSSVVCLVLQGETFTGLSQHQRIFPNVASEHHFLSCSGVTAAWPPLATVKGLVLVNVFTNLALIINVPRPDLCPPAPQPSAWQPTPGRISPCRFGKSVPTIGTNLPQSKRVPGRCALLEGNFGGRARRIERCAPDRHHHGEAGLRGRHGQCSGSRSGANCRRRTTVPI
jgi:hypothetical protein